MFEIVDDNNNEGQSMGTISSPCEPDGSGELKIWGSGELKI